jgi:hypothetical protein
VKIESCLSPEVAYVRERYPAPDAALHAKQHRKTLLSIVDTLNGHAAGVLRLAVQAEISMTDGSARDEILRDYRAAIETIDVLRNEIGARLDEKSA